MESSVLEEALLCISKVIEGNGPRVNLGIPKLTFSHQEKVKLYSVSFVPEGKRFKLISERPSPVVLTFLCVYVMEKTLPKALYQYHLNESMVKIK